MSNLIQINPQDYSLDNETANSLINGLPTILEERQMLVQQYTEAIKLDVEHPDSAAEAKKLRLLIRDNRTKGIEKWHKANKEIFLRGGQFVDAVKRKYADENKDMEAKLEEIEKWQEIQEAKAKEERRQQRMEQIAPYVDSEPAGIAEMDYVTFKVFAKGLKEQWEQDQAEAKAAAEEQERIRKENEALRKKQQELEARLKAEEQRKAKEEAEAKAKQQAELAAKKAAEKAPDVEKLKAFIDGIASVQMPSMSTDDAGLLAAEFEAKRQGFIKWMKSQL
jgi:DNA repair exonuclease SbcCD ATPase subunit